MIQAGSKGYATAPAKAVKMIFEPIILRAINDWAVLPRAQGRLLKSCASLSRFADGRSVDGRQFSQ
jgi:hypothetical protein